MVLGRDMIAKESDSNRGILGVLCLWVCFGTLLEEKEANPKNEKHETEDSWNGRSWCCPFRCVMFSSESVA